MQMNKHNISFFKIIKNDNVCLLSLVMPVICCIFYVIVITLKFFGLALVRRGAVLTSEMTFYFIVFVTVIALPIFLFRIFRAVNIFRKGIEVTGKVTKMVYDRNGGYVFFEYNIMDSVHNRKIVVVGDSNYNKYKVDQEKQLLVNPESPSQILIKELYK